MTNPGTPPVPEPPPDPRSQEISELLRFIREENEAYRGAIRDDSQATRNMLLGSIRIVAYPIAVVFAIAAFMGLKSWHDMKAQIRAEADSATKTEVKLMRQKIDNQLTEEFQEPNIRATIRDAAREATETAARPLIKEEVSRQVEAEKAALGKEYTRQYENEFNRIRDFRANLVIETKPSSQYPPFVLYFLKGTQPIAELTVQGGPTSLGAPQNAFGLMYPEDLFPPIKAQLLNQRISTLDGINKVQLVVTNSPNARPMLLDFLKNSSKGEIDVVLNSVTLYKITFNVNDLKLPENPTVVGPISTFNMDVAIDRSLFRSTEMDYKKAANK